MKLKDIIYKLTDKAIMPTKMGVLSTTLYDWISYSYYEETLPEITEALKICETYALDDDIICSNLDETSPMGFYRKYIHYFIVDAPRDMDITYFPRIAKPAVRHWINGKIAFIGYPNAVYTINLKKGYNTFCIEYGVELVYREAPLVRIEGISDNEHSIVSLTNDNYFYKPNNFYVDIRKPFDLENKSFEFSVVLADLIRYNYASKAIVRIFRENDPAVLYAEDIDLKREYKLDLSFISFSDLEDNERLFATFTLTDLYGETFEKNVDIFTKEIDDTNFEKVRKEAFSLLHNEGVPEAVKNEIRYYTQNKISLQDIGNTYSHLKTIIKRVKNGDKYADLYEAGQHLVYYYSEEDENYYYYNIVLPKNYHSSKKYPLLLTISHGHIDDTNNIETPNYSPYFAQRDDIIYADIGGRGCTIGSYMGERFIINEIKHIIQNFSVDENKIYATAHCSGNIALHNFAQIYPHLFAGIYTRMASVHFSSLLNLYNVPCMHLVATINTKNYFYNARKKIERNLRNFQFLCVHKYYNADAELKQVQYTKKAIDMLLSKKADKYPEIIYYRTERNRHRSAYYIEIESIEDGKNFAEFQSEIKAYNLIIHTKNCTGLKITLPPQIDREDFFIQINNKKIEFQKYYKDEIYLKHIKRKGFVVAQGFKDNICYYKGTGLLDVYLSLVKVINCNDSDDKLRDVAEAFAHPITNTMYSYIYVDYPIKNTDEILKSTNSSLIIVDNNCASLNRELAQIRSLLPIQMDKNGYSYNGQRKNGPYCLMQVISNPWKNDCSILYINTNDKTLFSSNFFTRKAIIPSYNNGYHPYLNGMALLFDGKKYFSVREWGQDFAVVE